MQIINTDESEQNLHLSRHLVSENVQPYLNQDPIVTVVDDITEAGEVKQLES